MSESVLQTLTKYELQTLLWAIHYVRERTNNCGDTMRELQRKIQIIVDAFCTHEFYLDGLGINALLKCYKCAYVSKGKDE